MTFICDGEKTIAKHNATQDEVDVTLYFDLSKEEVYINNLLKATRWFQQQNQAEFDVQAKELVDKWQTGRISKSMIVDTLTQSKAKITQIKLLWECTPTFDGREEVKLTNLVDDRVVKLSEMRLV